MALNEVFEILLTLCHSFMSFDLLLLLHYDGMPSRVLIYFREHEDFVTKSAVVKGIHHGRMACFVLKMNMIIFMEDLVLHVMRMLVFNMI
jgi:hypothetical protein